MESLNQAAIDLFTRKRYGHMGEFAYYNGGAEKFEKFTKANPFYYLYHGEIEHIRKNKQALAMHVITTEHVIVIGPGPASSFENKDLQIIELLPHVKSVTFIDLSSNFNKQAEACMEKMKQRTGRQIEVKSYEMDYRDAPAKLGESLPHTTVISTGSLVCNVPNAPLHGFPDHDMEDMLRPISQLMGASGHAILGYDSNNDIFKLRKAYNEQVEPWLVNLAQIIHDHADKIKGFNPDPSGFRYENDWLDKARQMPHKLVVVKPQRFTVETPAGPRTVTLNKNDEFILMPSLKPETGRMTMLGENVGMETSTVLTDRHGLAEHVFHSAANGNTAASGSASARAQSRWGYLETSAPEEPVNYGRRASDVPPQEPPKVK